MTHGQAFAEFEFLRTLTETPGAPTTTATASSVLVAFESSCSPDGVV